MTRARWTWLVAATVTTGCLAAPSGRPAGDDDGDDASVDDASGDDASVDAIPDAAIDPDATDVRWPPPGLRVAGVAAGDLDGDGIDDLAIVSLPSGGAGGVYLIDGATDLDYAAANLITRYTAYLPLASAAAPIAVMIADVRPVAGADVVVAYNSAGAMTFAAVAGDGTLLGTVAGNIPAPATSATVWLDEIDFGGGQLHTVLSASELLTHVSTVMLDDGSPMVAPIPPPMPATSWSGPQAIGSYPSGGRRVAVATGTAVAHSEVPTTPPPTGMFVWTDARTGPMWNAQRAVDLTGDDVPEFAGLTTAMPPQLCIDSVVDGNGPACMNTTLVAGSLIAFEQFTAGTVLDLLAVSASPTSVTLSLQPDLQLDLDLSTVSAQPALTSSVTLTDARVVLAHLGHGTRAAVIAIGSDGVAACRVESPGALGACAAP